MSRWGSTDEQLLGRLLAPPELHDGVESLDYWSRRSRGLPWYRIRARREAVRMTVLGAASPRGARLAMSRAARGPRLCRRAGRADSLGAVDATRRDRRAGYRDGRPRGSDVFDRGRTHSPAERVVIKHPRDTTDA